MPIRCRQRRAFFDAANREVAVIGDTVKTAFARHSRVGGLRRQDAGANIRVANGPKGKPRMQGVNPVPCDFDKTSHWIPAFAGMTNSEVQP